MPDRVEVGVCERLGGCRPLAVVVLEKAAQQVKGLSLRHRDGMQPTSALVRSGAHEGPDGQIAALSPASGPPGPPPPALTPAPSPIALSPTYRPTLHPHSVFKV